jgi:ankyrin repeat protein
MKTIFSAILLLGILNVTAQKNAFLGRSFWDDNTSIEQVQTAINEGNNPTVFNAFSFDATAYAILEKAPFTTIKFLLSIEGNEVSKITHDGRNYLMWAGYKGDLELIEYLISSGSDINLIDEKGYNLQTFTAMGGTKDQRVYELYINSGLKLTAPNRDGGNIVHYLAQHVDDIKDFDYFTDNGLSIMSKDNDNNTVFHYASSQGNVELLEQLIAAGLNPKALNNQNKNALFFAAKGKRRHYNELTVFEYLVKLGLDPKLTNKNGNNLLHYAAIGNKSEAIFAYLMKMDVDLQKVNDEGNTPLMNSVWRNNTVGITALYSLTKDKNIINDKGYSLLTYALRNKNSELVESLLDEGLDYNLADKSGDNLLTHLVDTYDEKNASFFEQYYKMLIKKEVAVQNYTIHIATSVENEFLVKVLLESGVDINAKNEDGITALQLAAMKCEHTEFLKFLINKGADKEIKTDFEESVYDLAKSNELLEGDLEFLK